MDVVLAIIAIAMLLVLIVASLRQQRATTTAEKHRADARAHVGDAQHEASRRHRAAVRGAAEERIGTSASPTGE